jgi:hypothetical protein
LWGAGFPGSEKQKSLFTVGERIPVFVDPFSQSPLFFLILSGGCEEIVKGRLEVY